ncbi:glycoside hydrolase family 15 protein [Tengunoibacter tsumagoiensis]|uniref:Glucoamylase n=1 Tax=Tengunoibacter tsumagoiensis TaxID=2014871 RepID=A0A402A3X3_9CHLR|nr:glycoside hydrolase family 15 protein [Tengunoibacter tsumagoiensis]GCE13844.1 glucoamylase [Tengunoibacter tsumagoiensis]
MRYVLSRYAQDYLPIEDYGIIGDLQTVALVGRNGSIDWCCIPSFDAPSVFGALLDSKKGGFFRIAPPDHLSMDYKQHYLPESNILLTRFFTVDGVGEVTDYMPVSTSKNLSLMHHIIRRVHVVQGSLPFEMTCKPAFNYARDPHIVHMVGDGAVFESPQLSLSLSSTVPMEPDEEGGVHASFVLEAGQTIFFLLQSSVAFVDVPAIHSNEEFQENFLETLHYWQSWISQCRYQGRWREHVHRSALALKLLTYAPTGAIVAAATTSLPEGLGGVRNWDYRFTWLRDASLTLNSLLVLGFSEEADAFMHWVESRCHEMEPNGSLQPMYTIHGGHDMEEHILDHLEGYRQSKPVRIGNGAFNQLQLDIYGELLDAVYTFDGQDSKDLSYDLWMHIYRLLDWLGNNWNRRDEGIWEVRGGTQNFVHSRVMCWVAFDRALRISRARGFPAPRDKWTNCSAEIYTDVMRHGWNDEKKCFVQHYETDEVDASALLIALTKFVGPTDPRMLHTVNRIMRKLMREPHVYRYIPERAANDGVGGPEGTFSFCSFLLVDVLSRAGRLDEARLLLEQMLTYANHVGLYAEEIGLTGESLGNFPQAFTHLSMISACYNLDQALNRAQYRY